MSNIYPVIFVPGILGTKLYDHYPLDHQMLYDARFDSLIDFEPLMLDENGLYDANLDTLTCGSEFVTEPYNTIVNELREDLTLDGTNEHIKVYPFPYDWRYSIKSNAEKLGAFVDLIICKTKAHKTYKNRVCDKVDIVTHSMGACIAKYYATVMGNEKKINKLVMLAPALRGSLYALKQLIMGDTDFFGLIAREDKRKAARTFPGLYNLLPFDGFFSGKEKTKWDKAAVVDSNDKAVNIFDESKWQQNVIKSIKDEIGPNTLETHLSNTFSFFNEAKDFSSDFGKKVLSIYGTGVETLRQVTVSDKPFVKSFYDFDGVLGDGDGTVPIDSAYCDGTNQVSVKHEFAGDLNIEPSRLAGFHASFCSYQMIIDLCVSFLKGEPKISVSRSRNINLSGIEFFSPKY